MTKSESAFPVEEMKTIADKILKSLRDNPILLPPPVAIPGMPAPVQDGFKFHCHFGAYHYAEAYMLSVPYFPRLIPDSATITNVKRTWKPLILVPAADKRTLNI